MRSASGAVATAFSEGSRAGNPRGWTLFHPPRGTRSFWLAAWLCAVATLIFLVVVSARVGGAGIADGVDDVGELAAALVASAACWSARSRQRRSRATWGFLAASSMAWGCGEAVWTYYDLIRGVQVPFPSLADVGFLAAVPLAVVGLLAFDGGRYRSIARLTGRAVTALVGFAAFLAMWGALDAVASHRPVGSILAPVIAIAYPLGDTVTAAAVVVTFRRAQRDRVSLGLVLAGVLSFVVADTSFAYFTAAKSFGIGNGLDTGWVLGYLLMALGALWTVGERRIGAAQGGPKVPVPAPAGALATVGGPPAPSRRGPLGNPASHAGSRVAPSGARWLVGAVGLMLIAADAGVFLYDAVLMAKGHL